MRYGGMKNPLASRYENNDSLWRFARQSTPGEWEERLRPARPYINDLAALAGLLVFLGVILFFLPDARDGLMAWRGR